MFSVFAAAVEHVGDPLKITYNSSWKVAFGKDGDAVLTDKDHIYLYRHNGVEYILKKKARLPHDVKGQFCNKAVGLSSSTVFVQDSKDDARTYKLHPPGLDQMGTLNKPGLLSDILYTCELSTLVYRHQKKDGSYCIYLHHCPDGDGGGDGEHDGEPVTLEPRPKYKWERGGLSVCCTGDHFVVVENNGKSMDVFSTSGNTLLWFFCHIPVPIEYVN